MIRVICATHRDIEDMIQTQTFREDLYYRISDITLELPPLREREDDVLLLANTFLTKYAGQQGKSVKGLSPATDQVLLDYECKGNVRELEKIIRRAVIMSDGNYIKVEDLSIQISKPTHKSE